MRKLSKKVNALWREYWWLYSAVVVLCGASGTTAAVFVKAERAFYLAQMVPDIDRRLQELEFQHKNMDDSIKPIFYDLNDTQCRDNLKSCGKQLNKLASKKPASSGFYNVKYIRD